MKRLLFSIILSSYSLLSYAQTASVEKSVYGIQTGLLGLWGHNEVKMGKQLVLRSELGFDSGIWGGDYYEKTGFLLTPILRVEPKWYYNLNKRVKKNKRIDGNSGNFLSLQTSYHPDWFVISNYDDIHVISDISIIPSWGIRRNIGKHFNYETGIGLGYRYIFAKNAGYTKNESSIAGNWHLRIGYKF